MRYRNLLAALLVLSLSPVAALASFGGGGGGSKPDTPSSDTPQYGDDQPSSNRKEAERYYGDAYNDVAKAKKDLGDPKKKKDVDKRFAKALERGEKAVALDSTYYEAWNLVGYCARNLSQFDQSIAAYDKCLSIKPDFAPAHEYLGETYLALGKADQAREQLAWLEKLNATPEAADLKTQLDAYVTAHPEAAAAPTPTAATPDTTASTASSSKP